VSNLPCQDAEEGEAVDREISRRLDDGSMVISKSATFVASPIGAVPKPPSSDGAKKYRVIHHLSWPRRGSQPSVNDGIDPAEVTLSYDTLGPLLEAIAVAKDEGRQVEIWKVDFANAFRHCVTETSDSSLNGCIWGGRRIVDCTLPFGLRSSPFLFNLFSEGFHWILQSLGLNTFWHYLDDFYGLAPIGMGSRYTDLILRACTILGWTVAPHKVVSGCCVPVLGVLIDTDRGIASITPERRAAVAGLIDRMVHSGSATRREIQSVAGSLLFISRICPTGRAYIRRIFDATKSDTGYFTGARRIPGSCKTELRWWGDLLQSWDGAYIIKAPAPTNTIDIYTDASGEKGFGGHIGHIHSPTEAFSERFPRRHRDKDIQFKESYAALHACRLWAPNWSGRHIVFHIDNQAVFWALRTGRIRNDATQTIIRTIFASAASYHFTFTSHWIASEDNGLADALSRFHLNLYPPAVHDMLSRPRVPPTPYPSRLPVADQLYTSMDPITHPFSVLLPPDVSDNSDGTDYGAPELVVFDGSW